MVDLWCGQNKQKQIEIEEKNQQKQADAKQIALDNEQIEIQNQINQKNKLIKQEELKNQLRQQIVELRKCLDYSVQWWRPRVIFNF